MPKPVTLHMLDRKTPSDVIVTSAPRRPETDPTLGIKVKVNRQGTPRHRLVTIGDSLTHGYQSGAIFNTSLSYPAIIARELGCFKDFRYPTYNSPSDGLPLNIERLARDLEDKFGSNIDWWELVSATSFIQSSLDTIEDYWENGAGSRAPSQTQINHNLAVYGWDLRNTIERTADICQQVIANNPPKDDFVQQIVQNHNERAALRVLNSARDAAGNALSPLKAAAALGAAGSVETGEGDGIETLIILIGANNALGSILTFKLNWTSDGYDDMAKNDIYTVWRPVHFKAELDLIVEQVKKTRARHVIWGTVPHVTIVPFARGVGSKVDKGSRYFPYYTLPWMTNENFDPNKHPHLKEQEARAIDSAIDQYNKFIADAVRSGRQEGRDWYLFETVGLLDRLASRRYIEDPDARPDWWTPYPLPPAVQALTPEVTSRFYLSNANGRIQGGLFSLDGIHPTTIGYGIIAQELINIMHLAGVKFNKESPDGTPIKLNFNRLIELDTLISKPPRLAANIFNLIGWVDNNFNVMARLLNSNY